MADAYVQATRLKAFAPVYSQVSNIRFQGRHRLATGEMPPAVRHRQGQGAASVNTQVVTTTGDAGRVPPMSAREALLYCVSNQERLEQLLPKAAYLIIFGIFALLTLSNEHRDMLGMIIGAIFTFFIAKLFVRGVRGLILEPMRRIRYDRVATRLRLQIQASGDIAVGPFSWTLGAPGAMGMTSSGELIIVDRGHAYEPLKLLPHQIADVRVECNSKQFTQTLHSGRTTLAGFGKSFGMGYTMGGSSTSVTNTINEYFLEIRYQAEKNGMVATVVVPGGRERRVVEELCATIKRLQA